MANKAKVKFAAYHIPDDTQRAAGEEEERTDWQAKEFSGQTWVESKVQAATGGTTVTTSGYTAVALVAVWNTDPTNYVDATYRTAANGANDNKVRIQAGEFVVLPDFTKANNLTLTANTAACWCHYLILKT